MTTLPKALAARVSAFLEGDLHGDAPLEALAADLAQWLDGKPADTLRALLDHLRDGGGYGLSLRLLARAWEGTLSDAMAGEVAQDWIGTLLHGLGDRAAAVDVARHVTPGALARGAAFAGDLGDLLLSWDLRAEADPLVEFAARRNPSKAENCVASSSATVPRATPAARSISVTSAVGSSCSSQTAMRPGIEIIVRSLSSSKAGQR